MTSVDHSTLPQKLTISAEVLNCNTPDLAVMRTLLALTYLKLPVLIILVVALLFMFMSLISFIVPFSDFQF
jgi:hypothetical protein